MKGVWGSEWGAQAECDKSKCCQWCGSVFNLTAGFCMPMMDIPVPTLTCSKGGALCTSAITEVRERRGGF